MTIRRRCTERNCKNGRRCLEHLRFDVMWHGKRYRIPAITRCHQLGYGANAAVFARSPFHRFGVRLNKKAETIRDRRVSREEEKRLLDTSLREMNTAPHRYVGEMLHDRIIGALELCCRRGEMLLQNKCVSWDTCQIGIPGANAKDKENRRIPFNPDWRPFSSGGRRWDPTRSCSGVPTEPTSRRFRRPGKR